MLEDNEFLDPVTGEIIYIKTDGDSVTFSNAPFDTDNDNNMPC